MGDRKVITHGLQTQFWQDIYYYAMTSSWPAFFGAIAVVFFSINLIFAGIFMLGDDPIGNLSPKGFLGAFFFSVETVATVGYGDMHPQTIYGHIVSTVEIFLGMASVALITGVMFARFSRPRSQIIFARHPVTHFKDGQEVLLIRMANARLNVISEATARLRLLRDENSPESGLFRKLHDLKLEREQHPVFALGWTIIHVIDESSPLFGLGTEILAKDNAALILSVEGVDETTSQTLRARYVYTHDTIRSNHRYANIFSAADDEGQHIDYSLFHDVEALPERQDRPA
ncbi:ion channel [Undibacterium terreum]|uniref:Inward rectifier potassium channel protein n=1 Tax=Undibacterium terreum TaxID=1224302 RepID=A0A916U5Y2_9BURK|nr:ion channel [Undibacterium terreum]GGC60676.1 inward rectifier potassium channel protein [Undibacterium terreum]